MKVVVLPQAEESLKRSLYHLSAHYDKVYLKNLERLVRRKVRWLGSNPGAGQFEPELAWTDLGHRRLVVRTFKVIYRVHNGLIVVNDIFDSRRDPNEMKT